MKIKKKLSLYHLKRNIIRYILSTEPFLIIVLALRYLKTKLSFSPVIDFCQAQLQLQLQLELSLALIYSEEISNPKNLSLEGFQLLSKRVLNPQHVWPR